MTVANHHPLRRKDHYRRDGPLRPGATAFAIAAFMALPVAAAPLDFEWLGFTKVFIAQWSDSGTDMMREFPDELSWRNFCLGLPSATCTAPILWGLQNNWLPETLPGSTDTVRIAADKTVWIGSFESGIWGSIGGTALAGTLIADGTIQMWGGSLYTDDGFIGHLNLTAQSKLVNNGTVRIANLDVSAGRLWGTGTTVVDRVGDASFSTVVQLGHTLQFNGAYAGLVDLSLSDQSRFVNAGRLDATVNRVRVSTHDDPNGANPSLFVNTGTIDGQFTVDGPAFQNDGLVHLGLGSFDAMYGGTHHGSFVGSAGTEMWFGSLLDRGHRFAPDSVVSSAGRVLFQGNNHLVEGTYQAAETVIGASFDYHSPWAAVTFTGAVGPLGRLSVSAGSYARFETAAGISFDELVAGGSNAFIYLFAGGPSTVQTLTLASSDRNSGLNTTSLLTVAERLDWHGGALVGPVTVQGSTVLGDGQRSFGGTLRNEGTLSWNAGEFVHWNGRLDNAAGGVFEIAGSFAIADATGSFDNDGLLLKSGGNSGMAMPMAFNNRGTVDVRAGTLDLTGGGVHTGSFIAATGARITLAGDHTIAGAVASSGQVDVTSGRFILLDGASYTHASPSRMSVGQLGIGSRARFDNDGWFGMGLVDPWAQVDNLGQLNNRGSFTAATLNNGATGSVANAAGADMHFFVAGSANLGTIDNAGSFEAVGLSNAGLITNRATMSLVNLSNSGQINNYHVLELSGSISHNVFNSGSVTNLSGLLIDTAGQISGPGSFASSAGSSTWVKGLLEAQAGIHIDGELKGSGVIVGDVTLGQSAVWRPGDSPGTMTVRGNVGIAEMAPACLGWPGYESSPCNIEIEIASSSVYDRLVVDGDVSWSAGVDFHLLNGYTPSDGDMFTWISANRIDGFVSPRFFGLPQDWHGELIQDANSIRMMLVNEPEDGPWNQIPFSGSVSIAAGQVASNWPGFGSIPFLDRLDNAGWFLNKQGADLYTSTLANQPGGVVSNSGRIFVQGALDNAGSLRNRPGAELTVDGTLTNTGSITNQGSLSVAPYTWANLVNEASGRIDNSGIIERGYGAQIVNRGEFVVSGELRNGPGWWQADGTIRNEGGRFVVAPGGLVSGGGSYQQVWGDAGDGITQVDGRFEAASFVFYSGILTGSGTLAGPVTLQWARVQPGNSIGTLAIDGNVLVSSALFEIELAGAGQGDRLHVTGMADLAGSVWFLLEDGYRPRIGDSFAWLQADGGIRGLERTAWSIMIDLGGGYYEPWQPPAEMQLRFHDGRLDFSAVAVPEPGTWALMFGGLGVLAWVARKRSVPSLGSYFAFPPALAEC